MNRDTLISLRDRVRAATGSDLVLSADICVALGYGGESSEGAANVRTDPDWDGDLLFEIDGEECCNPIPAVSSSIDAALALVERVLPGCGWSTNSAGMASVWQGSPLDGPVFSSPEHNGYEITPPLAILDALLTALIERGE